MTGMLHAEIKIIYIPAYWEKIIPLWCVYKLLVNVLLSVNHSHLLNYNHFLLLIQDRVAGQQLKQGSLYLPLPS